MVRCTLKILQQMLQEFESVSDNFGTLCIKGIIKHLPVQSQQKKRYNKVGSMRTVNVDVRISNI